MYALHLRTPEEAQTLAALLKGEQGGGHSQDPDGGAAAASVTTGSDSGA